MAHRPGKKRIGKIIALVAMVLVILVIVARVMSRGKKDEDIKTITVRRGSITSRLTETGNIELVRSIVVKSKIAGTVVRIYVKEGDPVRNGQALCVIEPDPTQTLSLFQKRSNVDRTEIELERARKDFERISDLASTALVSQKELEDADNALRIARNAYNLAKLELEILEREIETAGAGAEERITSSTVRAPIGGIITDRKAEEGVLVTSGMSSVLAGTDLFEIGDPSTKIITASISEVDIGNVSVGTPVRIMLDAYPDTTFRGEIRHIAPVGKLQQGRNVISFDSEVEILDEDPRLMPGMSCDVDIIIAENDSALILPVEAVYEQRPKEGPDGTMKGESNYFIYIDTKQDTVETKQKRFGFLPFVDDSFALLDRFTEHEVEIGIIAENAIEIIAEVDTTTQAALDAIAMHDKFEKLRAEKKKKEGGEKNDAVTDTK